MRLIVYGGGHCFALPGNRRQQANIFDGNARRGSGGGFHLVAVFWQGSDYRIAKHIVTCVVADFGLDVCNVPDRTVDDDTEPVFVKAANFHYVTPCSAISLRWEIRR